MFKFGFAVAALQAACYAHGFPTHLKSLFWKQGNDLEMTEQLDEIKTEGRSIKDRLRKAREANKKKDLKLTNTKQTLGVNQYQLDDDTV